MKERRPAPDESFERSPPSPEPAPAPRAPETEAELMARLRPLVESDPSRAVELARDGARRFGETDVAPERAWSIVKSLANLRRFREARDQAQAMVEKYPDTEWTEDVRRHLLVYPLDQPSREAMQDGD